MGLADLTLREFLTAAAAKEPVPGGGAVAALTLAQGAALGRMVLQYTLGKRKYEESETANRAIDASLAVWQQEAMALAEADAEGYRALNELFRLETSDPKRMSAWPTAVEGAIAPPLAMTALAEAQMEGLGGLANRTNPQLRSDLAIAALLTEAGCRAAAWNVEVNLPLLADRDRAGSIATLLRQRIDGAREAAAAVEAACRA
ncbi:MAG: cyclodeaminase/cyclohydrolase family protein [Phycisphaerales bacterium]|nr:cyclodeaminase/cyclohydrolase family protein [Phycisphaerales bacterium]